MKRKLCLFLAVLLLLGLTACGGSPDTGKNREPAKQEEDREPGKQEETTEPMQTEPALVDVEVLTQIIYYDDENTAYSNYTFELDEMGRVIRDVQTDGEGNIIADNNTRWKEDGSGYTEGFVYRQVNNGVEERIDLKLKRDRNGGRHSVWVRSTDGVITEVEARTVAPEKDRGFSWYLPVEQYEAGDWDTSGWKCSHDEEGNLLCSISWEMAGILMEAECKYKSNGDLLYRIQKENGEVTYSEEVTYDKKGRPVYEVYGDTQISEWTYNDVANTGEWTAYLSDFFGAYEGLRKNWSEEYVYDSDGKMITAYGKYYDDDGQTVTGTYNVYFEYDENGNCIKKRTINNESGKVTVESFDAHGNQILVEYYDAAGELESSQRTDYIYTTIQVTPEVAEKYHSGK